MGKIMLFEASMMVIFHIIIRHDSNPRRCGARTAVQQQFASPIFKVESKDLELELELPHVQSDNACCTQEWRTHLTASAPLSM